MTPACAGAEGTMKNALKAALKAHGLDEQQAEGIAADAASRMASGLPAAVDQATAYRARHVKGKPRMTAHAVRFGAAGWLCWVETTGKTGGVSSSGAVMVPCGAEEIFGGGG
jgi:hypothetical protein